MCEYRQREYLGCGHLRWLSIKNCDKFKQYGKIARCEPQVMDFEESPKICGGCLTKDNPPHARLKLDPNSPWGRYLCRP
ncbi:hypothetical protein QBC36DRAFT_347482 [Triangularia setosa]|uniref:Uncharacterized protein n=1 Tax=Triangularia setosa TaxID=2587417 RepID=A0AAN6W4R1_9PEZI|nr:hypothetical protein QBC36DRAFT_347482 [Podospora setosa]